MNENSAHTNSQLKIGRYAVEARLGEGGMAETWLCRLHGAKGFSKRVVIKTLRQECRDADYQTMFADEARIGARLDHPNIPKILEFGETQGVPYLVQEYVEGPSVFQILQRQKLRRFFDVSLGCRIVSDVALALDHAYNATDEDGRPLYVIHRDVSPSNVLVSRKGSAKLIDFGVAMFEDRETRTQTGVLKGKLRYMAPEVLLRDAVSHQSDLYSLGIMLYALVVGEPAWSGADEVADRLRGLVEPPSSRRRDLPAEIDRIVMKCLAVDPTARYKDGRELSGELLAYLSANGGVLTDHQVAEQITDLFPDGPRDWMGGHDLTFTSLPTRQVPTRSAPIGMMVIALTALGGAVLSLSLTAAVILWYISASLAPSRAEQAAPEVAADLPADPKAAAVTLLDSAERALAQKDIAVASNQLRAAAALQISDPDLLSRRERLSADLQVTSGVKAARELITVDLDLALQRTLSLDNEYPGEPEIGLLLAEIRLALAEKERRERKLARSNPSEASPKENEPLPPAPKVVPDLATPNNNGLLDVFGENPAVEAPSDPVLKDPFGQQPEEGANR